MAASRAKVVDEDDFLQSVDDLFFSDFFPNTDQASSFVTRFNAIMPLAAEDPTAYLSIPPPSYGVNAPLPLVASSSSAGGNGTKNGQSKASAMADLDDSSLPETNKRVKTTRKTPEERAQHRRELNKKNAARSRLRKKFKIESVIVRAAQLEQENALLKSALKQHGIDIPLGVTPPGGRIKDEELDKISKDSLPADYAMLNAIQMSAANFILTDATKPDYPIVFASPGFLEMTGYSRSEVMGRNCRFLQGEHTDHETVSQIRKSIHDGHDIGVTILNYKKDGTPFWNQLFVAPLADQNNQIKYHVGVQRNLQVVNITGDLDADAPGDD